ncbi:MAG: hypothetical protein AAF539_06210 [Planctomycetota bacterium]
MNTILMAVLLCQLSLDGFYDITTPTRSASPDSQTIGLPVDQIKGQPPLVNGPIEDVKPFTLLLVTNTQPSQGERYLSALIETPRAELAAFRNLAYAQSLPVNDATLIEKHQDILADIQRAGGQLPLLTLIDDEGRRWGTWFGQSLPGNEYEISRQLQTVLAAGIRARQRAVAEGREVPNGPTNPVRYLNRNEAMSILNDSNVRTAGFGDGLFRPNINPQINVPPGGIDARLSTGVTGTVDSETRQWLMTLLLIAGGFVLAAVHLHGRAVTDRPEDVDEDYDE